jgi:hypothetical protein
MVNPLTSLNYPFRIPTLLITTWRGEPGRPDEPQHVLMGQITHRLLETMQIPWLAFPTQESQIAPVMTEAEASMQKRQLPFALVMSEGSVAGHELNHQPQPQRATSQLTQQLKLESPQRMNRTDALQAILESLAGTEAVPGFCFVLARKEKLEKCEGHARTLSLDLFEQWRGLETNGQFRFTPPTHALLAFAQALRELEAEGGRRGQGEALPGKSLCSHCRHGSPGLQTLPVAGEPELDHHGVSLSC